MSLRAIRSTGALYGTQTARKRYRCEAGVTGERHYIEPGDRYVASALPPHDNDIGNERWWHMRLCMDCCPIEFVGAP